MSHYSLRAFPVAQQDLPTWACLFGTDDANLRRIAFYVWIVQDREKTILVDAGPPPNRDDQHVLATACQKIGSHCTFRLLATLEAVLKQANVAPDAIDILLITQPITYHTGGILPELFPRAKVYVPWAGMFEFLRQNPGHPPRHTYFTGATWSFIRQLLIEDRLKLTDGPEEVAPNVFFQTTGGHHPGSAAVKIKTNRGWIAILETAFVAQNVIDEIPIGIAENVGIARDVIRAYNRTCDLVLAGHDNTVLQRFPQGIIA